MLPTVNSSRKAAAKRRQLLEPKPIELQIFELSYVIWCVVLWWAGRGYYASLQSQTSTSMLTQMHADPAAQWPSSMAIKFNALGKFTYPVPVFSVINIIIIDTLWYTCGTTQRINWFDDNFSLMLIVKYKKKTYILNAHIYLYINIDHRWPLCSFKISHSHWACNDPVSY